MLAELQEAFTIDTESTDPALLRLHMVPAMPQFELTLEGNLERLTAKLRCVYENGPPPFPPGVENVSGFPLVSPNAPDIFLTRNLPAEAAAFRRLERSGFDLSEGDLVMVPPVCWPPGPRGGMIRTHKDFTGQRPERALSMGTRNSEVANGRRTFDEFVAPPLPATSQTLLFGQFDRQ